MLTMIQKSLFTFLWILPVLAGCAEPPPAVFENEGFTMGTHYSVKFVDLPAGHHAASVFKNIEAQFEMVNQSMSTYLDDSELSQLNKNSSTDWINISDDLYQVLKKSLEISSLSGGAFDVTVGSLVNLWGFGPAPEPTNIPSQIEIQKLQESVGYQYLLLHKEKRQIRKQRSDIYIDLSALAKGYAVDKAAQYLDQIGVKNYLLEIGGDLITHGHNHLNQPWRIAIEEPSANKHELHTLLELRDLAIATSGDYRNYYEREGKRYSHTINPKSGRPVEHNLASVSVLHTKTMDADALATALLVLGLTDGFDLAEKNSIAAFFIYKHAEGFAQKTTTAMKQIITQNRTSKDKDK